MNYLLLLVLAAAAIAANALEHGEGLDNPIIEFFEAPVRAFKTKVAEDVEPVSNSELEGKSVGVAKTPNNSWFRGNGLASWLMSRNAASTTTTTTPEVVLNTPVGSNQQMQTAHSPNRRRLVRRHNVRRRAGGGGGGGQYAANNNWNLRRNASPNKRRINRRPIEEDAYSNEDDYDEFSGGRHYQLSYDSVPYRSVSYDDNEDDDALSYMPIKPHKLRRGYSEQKKNVKPNSSFLQPFQDIPIQARPMRLRQNLPATKPIGTKQQAQHPNRKPASNANRKPANANSNNKNKKKKNKHKNKPSNVNTVQNDPVHFIVHPQGNGQLPVLIPVNKNKKNPPHNAMSDPMDYQNYQYIPIPIQAFNQGGGYKGIPQIQVIAQHTHTFRPHHGFPTEVILGPGGFDTGYGGQHDVPESTVAHKKKNNKHKGEMNSMNNNQNQKIVLANDEPLKNETPMAAIIEEHMLEPTKQTILVEEIMKPETTIATQTAGDELMEVTAGGEEKVSGTEVRSVDGRQHIVVPRHIFPIFGASSLVEVANNGRFLLKTGRDLKVDEQAIDEPVGQTNEKELLGDDEPVKEAVAENETAKPESEHSIKKKEEAPVDEKPATPAIESESALLKEEPNPIAVEKELSNPTQVRPEQLQDIPVAIVQDDAPVKELAHTEKSGRSVHYNSHKPILRSEIVHEKANGHFIVKSAVAPAGESRSRVHQNVAKDSDSEIQNIKITPIENSRAL